VQRLVFDGVLEVELLLDLPRVATGRLVRLAIGILDHG